MRRLRCLTGPIVLTLALFGAPAAAQLKQPRLDGYGDPLPDGVLLRLGSTRLQAGGFVTALEFTHDGNKIVPASPLTGTVVWEVATGNLLRYLPCASAFARSPDATHPLYQFNHLTRYGRIALSPDGRYVVERTSKGVVRLRVVATGQDIPLN